jgi:poly(3-hydroxybutyrate) depolymerase
MKEIFKALSLLLMAMTLQGCDSVGESTTGVADVDTLQVETPEEPTSPNPEEPVQNRTSTFQFVSKTAATCPANLASKQIVCTEQGGATVSWCNCYWPKPTNGQVYLYTLRETRVASGQNIDRIAYVYKPARMTAKGPLLFYLHGGHGNGESGFEKSMLPKIADGRAFSWFKNTATCKFKQDGKGYVNSAGASCRPPAVSAANSLPFMLVFPSGVLDNFNSVLGFRHWEDGRVPSPGFSGAGENRDDVGYMDRLIATIKTQEAALVDANRVYMSGASNGGMMTMRLACNAGNSSVPELGKVAAYTAAISALPYEMATGQQGREACAQAGSAAFSLTLMVGKDAATPDCPTAGCTTPTVSGDGLMPYGSFGGGPYSLGDTGRVIGSPNTEELFASLLESRVGAANAPVTTNLGFFSKKILYTFPASNIRLQVYESSYGLHSLMGTRMDFSSAFRIFESLSTFERDATGKVVYKAPSHITGTY